MRTMIAAVIGAALLPLWGCGPRQFGSSSGRGEAPPDLGYEDSDDEGGDDTGHVIVSGDDDEAWSDVEIDEGEQWDESTEDP